MTKKSDPLGRITGILVFLLGIALLAVIFKAAFDLLINPVPELVTSHLAASHPVHAGHAASTANDSVSLQMIGTSVLRCILRLAAMLVGVAAGSIIAGKGIHLYFTAASHLSVEKLPASELLSQEENTDEKI
jgi:hypothetical protein